MTNTKSSAQPPFDSVGFHITSALPLQTLRGIGMHHITSHDYHWDNRVRKNSYVLLQYTISGKGSFQTPDHTYPQQAGDLFLVQVPGDSQYSLPDDSECWDVLYLEFSSECLPLLYHIHQLIFSLFSLEFTLFPFLINTINKTNNSQTYSNNQAPFQNCKNDGE